MTKKASEFILILKDYREQSPFFDCPYSEAEAWLYLSCGAYAGNIDEYGMGVYTDIKALSKLWRWSAKKTILFLNSLEAINFIKVAPIGYWLETEIEIWVNSCHARNADESLLLPISDC